jgi:hypothetical protein
VIFHPCLLGEWRKLHFIYSVELQHDITLGKNLIVWYFHLIKEYRINCNVSRVRKRKLEDLKTCVFNPFLLSPCWILPPYFSITVMPHRSITYFLTRCSGRKKASSSLFFIYCLRAKQIFCFKLQVNITTNKIMSK